MRPVLVLRPEPGNCATCAAARAYGLMPHASPLFAYVSLAWHLPERARWDGLLIGSGAVFAQGGAGLDALRSTPVHAVGASTARAALASGFAVADTASGGLQPLVANLPPGRYLRLAGEAHVPLRAPTGVAIDTVIVYAAQPLPLGQAAIDLVQREHVVALVHSAEAARHFDAQCTGNNLPRQHIALACLGSRIADAAGKDWQALEIAQSPTDNAVLSLAQQMCQTV